MPGGINGVEATKQIKQVSPSSQIVILTSHADNEHVLPALRAGALSYVLKDVDVAGLVDVVRRAVKGEALLNSRITTHLVQEVRDLGTDGLSYLSEREHEFLLLVARGYSRDMARILSQDSHMSRSIRRSWFYIPSFAHSTP